MKQYARLASIAVLLSLSAKAAPFMAVGDGAELFVTSSLALQADDNIYLDTKNEQSDTVYSFTPGVDLVFGKGSATEGKVYYREEIRRYADNDNQDTELSSLGFNVSSDTGGTKFDLNASYAQVAQNDNDTRAAGDLVRRKLTNLGAKSEFDLTAKTSLGIGASFANTNYGPNSYTDSKIWTLPVDLYFKATEKLSWSAGYQYRSSDLSGSAIGSKDHFLNIGGRGEFSDKLTGQVRVGYVSRSFDNGKDDSNFGLDGNLAYDYSEKTRYSFNFSNDFGSSGTGDSTKNLTIGLSAMNQFTEQWYLSSSLNFRKIEYSTRTDDYLEGQLALTYTYNKYCSVTGSYTYRNNSSDNAAAEFTNNVFSLGANLRY